MARTLLAALLVASATAAAQTAPQAPPTLPQVSEPAPAPQQGAPAASTGNEQLDAMRREFEAKVEEAKNEVRQEMRAQMAAQSAAQGWEEEYSQKTRKLELFELDGYFRLRPYLFNKFDLGQPADSAGFNLFPRSPRGNENTNAGANMRFRMEPTLNVSEEVRVLATIDALDNVTFGSNPAYSNTTSTESQFGIFNNTQNPPQSALNALQDSIVVKRVWGEVSTPVGIVRFGRMPSNWGMGMLYNDGNCLDCDYGDNVDRVMFVTEPFAGWYVAPMVEFNGEGPTSTVIENNRSQPFDLSNADDNTALVLAIARRDTDQQRRSRLDNGLSIFNYGLHFSYRNQSYAPVGFDTLPLKGTNATVDPAVASSFFVPRNSQLYIPDLWAKFETKNWRLEFEGAAIAGRIGNRATAPNDSLANSQSIQVVQFGALAQAEYSGLVNGNLHLMLEGGFASGDSQPGFGNEPGRAQGTVTADGTRPFDGPQFICTSTGCSDHAIRNFRFNKAYYTDLILFREILNGITDAVYAKPKATYTVAEGFNVFGQVIGSRAVFEQSTPSGTSPNLGIELDAGLKYDTEDGFSALLEYGVLFPLPGLQAAGATANLETAQVIRGILAVRF